MGLELDYLIENNNVEVSFEGDVLFECTYSDKWIPYRASTLEDPEEGGYSELLEINDIPDSFKWLEDALFEIIEDEINS